MSVEEACKLFVAGLPDSISETVLRQLFEATGATVVDVSLPKDRASGRPRGFGFVTLSTEGEAKSARESLDGSMQAGRAISVRPFQASPPKGREPKPEGPGGAPAPNEDRTLYLGNLPYEVTTQDVEALFESVGVSAVVRVNLPMDPQGRARGFGFVTLGSAASAQSAVEALRDSELKGRRISASIAHARGDRPPRPQRPSGPRPPPRDTGGAPPAWQEPRGRPEPSGRPMIPPSPAFGERETFDEPRRRKKEAAKKKKRARGGGERASGKDFSSRRARGWMDDED